MSSFDDRSGSAGRDADDVSSALDALPDAVLLLRDGRVAAANAEAGRLLGEPRASLAWLPLAQVIDGVDGDRGGWQRKVLHPRGRSELQVDINVAPLSGDRSARLLATLRAAPAAPVRDGGAWLAGALQGPTALMILRGPALRCELANATAERLAGGRTLVGRTPEEILPDLPPEIMALPRRVYETGEPAVTHELPVALPGLDHPPARRWFTAVIHPLRDGAARVDGVMVLAIDVTEQVHARAGAGAAEVRATLLADAIPHIVWSFDQEGRPQHLNRRFYEYTGLERGRRDLASLADIVHPDDLAALLAQWQASRATGEPSRAEVRLRQHDGTWRWHLVLGVPLRRRTARQSAWIGTATDIEDTRRVQSGTRFLADASVALTASLSAAQTLQAAARMAVPTLADWCTVHVLEPGEAVPRQVVVAHADPEKVVWAEALARRYPPDARGDRGVAKVIRDGRPELYRESSDELLAGAAQDPEHLALLRGLGIRSAMVAAMRGRQGIVGAITFIAAESRRRYDGTNLLIAQELADRAAYAVENARLFDELEEAVRVRDDFLSIASHELKTPLTPLLLHVEGLQRVIDQAGDTVETERVRARLQRIARQIGRLEKLVSGLLDLARVRGGRLPLELAPADLVAVVREQVRRAAPDAAAACCLVTVDAPPMLVGRWDRGRLEQIVANLLGNAIKFGAGKPVEVAVREEQGWAALTVRDQGIGIAPEDQARIFERFERAVPSKRFGGFGLGPWVVRQIAEALGGGIEVESAVGAGSLFTVRLPLAGPQPRP